MGAMGLTYRLGGFLVVATSLCFSLGCDDAPHANPFDPPKDAPIKPPPVTESVKPKGPPELSVDNLSPKVGFSRVILKQPSDRDKLRKEIEGVREDFANKETVVTVDRNADPKMVLAFLEELSRIDAAPLIVKTSSRTDFPQQLPITMESKAGSAPPCSVVAMVMPDRTTSVWKLSGGTAGHRGKGLGGPDLSMTGETLTRYAGGCKQSTTLFFSGGEGIEWGLIYDLAASTKLLEKARFDRWVLLSEIPTAGRAVKLK
jgi:hypothetical protein